MTTARLLTIQTFYDNGLSPDKVDVLHSHLATVRRMSPDALADVASFDRVQLAVWLSSVLAELAVLDPSMPNAVGQINCGALALLLADYADQWNVQGG